MQTKRNIQESGNVLLCVLGAIVTVSLIGAGVLQSTTTRLNASTNHVRAWKEALSVAETGGDIAFAEVRKQRFPSGSPQWTGWTTPSGTTWSLETMIPGTSLKTQTVVEKFYFHPVTGAFTLGELDGINSWYRVRSKGTAPVQGLKRTGMDDALVNDGRPHFAAGSTDRGNGDSLLRKIDFNTDHFIATYGPKGDNIGKAIVPVTNPQISRRIEQIVTPVTPFFDAAIQAAGTFYGLGSAGYIDSYDSRNGPYDRTIKDNPASPYYKDSRHGSVQIGSATATVKGTIYGNLATDGGRVTSGNPGIITETIDNNVPFRLEDYRMPNTGTWLYQPPGSGAGQLPSTVPTGSTPILTPPARTNGDPPGGTAAAPTFYTISSLAGELTVNPVMVNGNAVDTHVAILVRNGLGGGDITGKINVNGSPNGKGVKLKVYFEGNLITKSRDIVNRSPTTANPYAGNMQFYGISPARDSNGNPVRTQTISLDSGGGQPLLAATFYAPSSDFEFSGAPDFIGTVVSKSFYANGNITWHYDRALNEDGQLLDFRLASYVEDTR